MRYFLLALLPLTLAQVSIARVMKDLFIAMPVSLMPMLDENARKDLVDICLSGMTTSLPNEWGGTSALQKLTDNYLKLREDSEGTVVTDMALLPAGRDTVVCVVRTLRTPQPVSEVLFFNSRWQELKADKLLKLPDMEEFPRSNDLLTEGVLPVEFMEAALDVTEQGGIVLTFTTNTSKHRICFRWNGKKFQKN